MRSKPPLRTGLPTPSLAARLGRTVILLLPGALLLVATLREPGSPNLTLWLGTAFQVLVCVLTFLTRQSTRHPVGPSLITLYVIGLGWLWLGSRNRDDWFLHLCQAILLVVPLLAFGLQILSDSGAPALRRARALADRLATRKDWPADLAACRGLPEVKALREALHIDAAPALALLAAPSPHVRVAALAALEFRHNWKPGQVDVVLQLALRAHEPLVRAGVVTALGNVDDRLVVEALAEFLRDPSYEVRKAATDAVLWDAEHRWSWIRHHVRRALADPACQDDGPLWADGQLLTPEAVADLTAWAAEKGLMGLRSALTLGAHYALALAERPDPQLLGGLRRQLADPHTPPPLRLELARLLQSHRALDRSVLEGLLDPGNPAPLRLTAAECLLDDKGAEMVHPEARAALHDLARLPNREIALATADVVQRRLGVDLGLPPGQPLPPVYSRQAAEVTRRVMQWAACREERDELLG